MTTYPNLKPHFFQIKQLPDYGLKIEVLESLEEKRFNVIIGNNLIINFQYNGIDTSQALTIFNFYKSSKGGLESFNIPTSFFQYDYSISNIIDYLNPQGLWRFNSAVQNKTQFYSLHDLSFDLKGVTE